MCIRDSVGSYYITLPSDVYHPTRPSDNTFSEDEYVFETFERWNKSEQATLDCVTGYGPGEHKPGSCYDPELAKKYSTLFDYWLSEIYVMPPMLTGLDADYIIVNLAAEKLSEENVMDFYTLKQKGGDETKAFWFIKIADLSIMDYYNGDLQSYTNKFWNETLLGHLIPFTALVYVDPNNPEIQSRTFMPGYTAIYVKDIKFPTDGDGPFQLVYVPPSFKMDAPGPLTGPLIYKINKEYNPNQ